jgi:hypothetical protein
MDKARKQGFELLMLGCAFFVVIGTLWMIAFAKSQVDFRHVYCSAKCVIERNDPYNSRNIQNVCEAAGAAPSNYTEAARLFVTRIVYPPSEFAITMPIALLPFALAQILWSALAAAGTILAAYLIWKSAAGDAPLVAGGLLCFFLANSPTLILGNPAGIVVGLCAIGAWCLIEERLIAAGVACMAATLLLKPHDSGLVWLFFVLAGGSYRRRGLQALAVAACAALPVTLWVWHLSPHWIQEMQSNLQAFTARGGINDPGPGTGGGRGIIMITDLQAVFSFFKDDPHFYNLASICVCAPLLAIWAVVTLRVRIHRQNAWLALAAIAPLTMLPVYHRQYDAKLILLMLPACAALWTKRGRLGWWSLAVMGITIVLNGDFTWTVLIHYFNAWYPPNGSYLTAFPVPLSLLAAACFFLWVYAQEASKADAIAIPELLCPEAAAFESTRPRETATSHETRKDTPSQKLP